MAEWGAKTRRAKRVDPRLVEEARDGVPGAFATLHERLRHRVSHVAVRILRDHHEAEDVAQEAFLAAHRNLSKLADPAAFETWLFRIAHNTAVDRARKAARCRPSPRAHDEDADNARGLVRVVSRTGAREGSPVAMTLFKAEFRSLADNVQETFRLRYQQGMSCTRIAEELSVSVSCVKTRLHRARRRLQDALRTGAQRR